MLSSLVLAGGAVQLLLILCGSGSLRAATFPPHPFVLVNAEELVALRQSLALPGWKRAVYEAARGLEMGNSVCGIRANADAWLERSIVIPGRGGHYHHFFCEDGTRLALPKEQRFEPGPYRCPHCGRTYTGEKYEAALRRVVHVWHAKAARDLALVYAIEQKPEYAARAADVLLKYADAYPGPHTGTVTGGMLFQSLDESMWIIPLAQAFDLIQPALTVAQCERIAAFLTTVAGGIRQCGVSGNWGSWHLSAVGVVGYATGNGEFVDWAQAAFKQQIRNDLGEDGLWPESVHTYHYFPLQAFVFFAEAAWHAGDDLYRWEAKPGKSLLSMFRAPLHYAYPDLRLPAINDGWFEAFVPADLYEVASQRAADPLFAWVLAQGYREGVRASGSVDEARTGLPRGGLYAFLFGKDILRTAPAPAWGSANFPGLGTCILRSANGAVLTFDYGPFLSHGQLDKMGITLFALDKLWAADYGTPGYGAAILPWYQGTLSHNTLVVDGRNQARTRENTVQVQFGGGDREFVSATTLEAYPGVSHTRSVVRVNEDFVVVDQLASDAEHTYDFFLHADGRLSLDGRVRGASVVASPSPWITGVEQRKPRSVVSGRWTDGGRGLAFWLSGTTPVTAMLGECPADTGNRSIPLLIARQKARNAEFVTVLHSYQGEPAWSVKCRGRQLTIQHRGGRREVVVLPHGAL